MKKSRTVVPINKKQESAFASLFRPYIGNLYQSAYRWTLNPHDAEDLVQDLAETVVKRLSELAAVDKPRPWLLRVMYNRFVDLHRRTKANPVVTEHALAEEDAAIVDLAASEQLSPESLLEQTRLRRKLLQALRELDATQRAMVMLFDVEGYSIREIAAIVDVPEGTVKSRLFRARTQLKSSISREPLADLLRVYR